jgi:hypothetical protein
MGANELNLVIESRVDSLSKQQLEANGSSLMDGFQTTSMKVGCAAPFHNPKDQINESILVRSQQVWNVIRGIRGSWVRLHLADSILKGDLRITVIVSRLSE